MAIEKEPPESRMDLHSRAVRLSQEIGSLMKQGDLTGLAGTLGQLRSAIDRLRVVQVDSSEHPAFLPDYTAALPPRVIRKSKPPLSLIQDDPPAVPTEGSTEAVSLLPAEVYGLQKAEGQILGSGLPWQNRTGEQWKLLVGKNDASRLFYLSAKDLLPSASAGDLLNCISSWQLEVPFKVFWDQDPVLLMAEMGKYHQYDTISPVTSYGQKTDDLAVSVQELFEDPLLNAYSLATRAAIKERNKFVRQPKGIPSYFNIDLRRQEILDGYDISEAKVKFQSLIEIFYPVVQKYSFKRSRQSALSA